MPEPTDRPAFWTPASKSASDLWRTYDEPMTKHTSQKDSCFQDSKPWTHREGTSTQKKLNWDRLKACKTQYTSLMRPLPRNQVCCTDIASKRVKHETKASCGHSAQPTLLHWYHLKACKTQYKSLMRALPRNGLCYTDIASERVKHNTKPECRHSRGTNFVALIPPRSV